MTEDVKTKPRVNVGRLFLALPIGFVLFVALSSFNAAVQSGVLRNSRSPPSPCSYNKVAISIGDKHKARTSPWSSWSGITVPAYWPSSMRTSVLTLCPSRLAAQTNRTGSFPPMSFTALTTSV